MDIYDIILTKDWFELTEVEKSELENIAATEQEYNLIKTMMLVSLDENETVPSPPLAMYKALTKHFPKKKSTQTWRVRIAAAASILAIFVLTIYFFNKEDNRPLISNNQVQPHQKPSDTTATGLPAITKIDTAKIILQPKSNPVSQLATVNTARKTIPPTQEKTGVVETTIAYEPELLSLVTELY